MTDEQKFKDITREKLIDIFYKIFKEEYNVPNYYLEDDPELEMLESRYEGVSDAWIAAIFDYL